VEFMVIESLDQGKQLEFFRYIRLHCNRDPWYAGSPLPVRF
jgi:hypothetical protein